jgi:hypothetical protein
MSHLAKVGGGLWMDYEMEIEEVDPKEVIDDFQQEIANNTVTGAVGDLLHMTRSRNHRQFFDQKEPLPPTGHTMFSASLPTHNKSSGTGLSSKQEKKKTLPIANKPRRKQGVSFTVQERPANREEIAALERELEERVKAVIYSDQSDIEAIETGNLYQPHKDAMYQIRDRILAEFNAPVEQLQHEPWLQKLIQCESLMIVCDTVASKLGDMLSVNSSEMGNVQRKLRLTYEQCFDQLRRGWKQLRMTYSESEGIRRRDENLLKELQEHLAEKEDAILVKVCWLCMN